ncbi:MAG: hypothetical protein LBG52_06255 [Candidatus Peribacteria bacterium]|jgi:hypothetical protein|nr:hypothetical protein [Candidatus Peribacteria bacterium]
MIQPYLQFYFLMQYPVPSDMERFFVEKKMKRGTPISSLFSWKHKSPLLDAYLEEIAKHSKLYQSLPFVETIYLCNSLTFNALHQESDIDLFIVAQPGRIWLAKFWAMWIFMFTGLKYSLGKKSKKFCLSFFITSTHQNLYALSLPNLDIYLCYWIQHLVPLYQAGSEKAFQIYAKNKWVKGVLPNYPEQQSIFLGNQVVSGVSKFKRFVEWLGRGVLGDLGEFFVKYLQLLVIRLKIMWDPERNKDVVTTDHMLKFHQDIREKISLKYRMLIKKSL